MRGIPEQPEGLRYVPGFLPAAQHARLLDRLVGLEVGAQHPGGAAGPLVAHLPHRPGRLGEAVITRLG